MQEVFVHTKFVLLVLTTRMYNSQTRYFFEKRHFIFLKKATLKNKKVSFERISLNIGRGRNLSYTFQENRCRILRCKFVIFDGPFAIVTFPWTHPDSNMSLGPRGEMIACDIDTVRSLYFWHSRTFGTLTFGTTWHSNVHRRPPSKDSKQSTVSRLKRRIHFRLTLCFPERPQVNGVSEHSKWKLQLSIFDNTSYKSPIRAMLDHTRVFDRIETMSTLNLKSGFFNYLRRFFWNGNSECHCFEWHIQIGNAAFGQEIMTNQPQSIFHIVKSSLLNFFGRFGINLVHIDFLGLNPNGIGTRNSFFETTWDLLW